MYIEIVILGIIIGGFRGGRLANLTELNLRGWTLILLSLLVSLSPIFLSGIEFLENTQVYLLFFSMVIMLIVLALNLDKKGTWIMLIGGLYNLMIMVFNNFKMPVSMSNLEKAGLNTLFDGITDGSIVNYVAAETTGAITVFTKFIAISSPYPFPKILSLGDVIMSLGLLIFIVGEMKKTNYYGKGKMVSYSYRSTRKRG